MRDGTGAMRRFIAVLFLLAASQAWAGQRPRPALLVRDAEPDICRERLSRFFRSLFGCGKSPYMEHLFLPGSAPEETSGERLLLSRRTQASDHPAARFSFLAGKFMGRVETASLLGWRVRFKVILE